MRPLLYTNDPENRASFSKKQATNNESWSTRRVKVPKRLTSPLIVRLYWAVSFLTLLAVNGVFASESIPFRPGEVWPDENGVPVNAHGGGILFHEGRYYWFGEHKIEGEAGNKAMVGVHCYSSENLYHWKDEGVALKVSEEIDHDISKGCILERPKVLRSPKTGKFVMWFHLELKATGYRSARSGVALSESITGPYRYIESVRPCAGHWPLNVDEESRKPLSEKEIADIEALRLTGGPHTQYPQETIFRRDFAGGQMARDMTLFQDDDGKSYHIYSSEENGTLHIAELSDDLLKHTGRYVRVLPGRFNEAPAVMKYRSKYYLFASGCTGWNPNPARLAVAEDILGPWRELDNPCRGTDEEKATTFHSQSTFLLPVQGRKDAWIFMADRWNPKNAIDGRYVWLPVLFDENTGEPHLRWFDNWTPEIFPK